jgi:hypothetical protein
MGGPHRPLDPDGGRGRPGQTGRNCRIGEAASCPPITPVRGGISERYTAMVAMIQELENSLPLDRALREPVAALQK